MRRQTARATFTMFAAAVAVAVACGLAGCSAGSSSPVASSPVASSPVVSSPVVSSPVASSVAPSSVASSSRRAGPWMEVTLTRTSPDGSRAVAVTASVHGKIHQYVEADSGRPLRAATSEGGGTQVAWGDGATGGSDVGDIGCSTDTALVPVVTDFKLQHVYAAPGRYKITFVEVACPPLKDITRTLEITVR